jgi:radical SAM superfamily enzyme YgiQ (UPF0313 family)
MSSLGFQTILYRFAALPGVQAGRVFLEEGRLHLLDGSIGPRRTDLFAFSVAAENDYPNILRMLSQAGFPLRSRDRDESFPLVLAGGIAPSLNPEPLAEFMDLIALGEGEDVLAPLVDVIREGRESSRDKSAVLEKMLALEGVYVPACYQPSYSGDGLLERIDAHPPAPRRVSRAWVRDLDRHPAISRIIAPGSAFEDLFLLEVNRGCGRGCRFCAAGHLCRPLRHHSLASLKSSVEEGSATLARFGLLGSAVADHPDVIELARFIVDRGWKFSVSSLRLDRLKPELLQLLYRGGCRTVTLAPETGSERLRWSVNKRIGDERILEAVEETARSGIPNVKLYFMVGLPTETDEDREAILSLLRNIQRHFVAGSRARRRIGTISVSLSSFVPKAWTPFQWHPFLGVGKLKKVLARLTKEARKIPNVTVSHDQPKWAYVQALLSRGDRRTADILEAVHRLKGAWQPALKESVVDPDFFVTRPRERNELLPWDFVDTGLKKETLWRQYRKALEVK